MVLYSQRSRKRDARGLGGEMCGTAAEATQVTLVTPATHVAGTVTSTRFSRSRCEATCSRNVGLHVASPVGIP